MATASVTYTTAAGYTGTGTLTYSVSSTNTATTFSATKFIVTSDYKTNYICRAVMDGDVFVNILHDGGGAISYTKSWNKSTSAQTKNLDLQWYETVNGQTRILKTTTVQISIPALASYSVTYNANGGTGTTASQTKYYGQNLTLRANGFTRTNYAFKCWNTNTSDPAASRYAASATYTGNAALALYAIWNPIISFNANGGSGAPSNQTKPFNSQFSLASLAVPTRTGYTFANWNTAANGSGTSYASNGTIAASMNTAITLYAQWTANTYTISFATVKGSGVPSSISKTYGQSVTLPIDRPVRIGHTFLGWALSSSAETAQWLPGANFSEAIAANTTLHAVWRDDYESPSITTLRAYRCGFELTTDTAIDPDKTYYERSGSGTSEDPYIYTEVEEPNVSDLPTYYELIDDDEAGYARIEATWSIDTSVDEGVVNSAIMTGTITPEGQPAQAITFQSGYQGTSGNAVALIDGLDVDTQYTVTVTVTDIKGASMATSRTVLLLRAFYIFDFGSQGNAVGIGRAAPQSGMEVGYRATFDDEVNLYDELQFNGEQAFPTFKRSSWTPASDETTLPVLPCEVVDEGTSEAFWCDEDGVHRINHAGMTWGQLASRYTWGELAPAGSTPGTTYTFPPIVEVATVADAEAITDIDRPFFAYVDADKCLYWVDSSSVTNLHLKGTGYAISYIDSWDEGKSLVSLDKATNENIWFPILSLRTKGGGGWTMGNYDSENLRFIYATKSNIDSHTNTVTHIQLLSDGGGHFPGVVTSQAIVTNPGALANYNEGHRFNRANSGWATIMLGGASGSVQGTAENNWLIGTPPIDNGRQLRICHNSSAARTYFFASANNNNVGLHMGGQLQFADTTALPDASTSTDFYLVGINAFANGGRLAYKTLANVQSFLGIGTPTSTTTLSSIISLASGISIYGTPYFMQYGHIAELTFAWSSSSAISVPANGNISNVTVGTIVSGKRPYIRTAGKSFGDDAGACWYSLFSDGTVSLGACEGTGSARTIAAGSVFFFNATYII